MADLLIPSFKVIFINMLRHIAYLTVLAANFGESSPFCLNTHTHTASFVIRHCFQTSTTRPPYIISLLLDVLLHQRLGFWAYI